MSRLLARCVACVGVIAMVSLWSPSAHAQTGDPCFGNLKTLLLINQTTGTQLLAGTANTKIYLCSIIMISATAQNLALVEGTGTVCATGTAGVTGGSTANTGFNWIANEGLTAGSGVGTLAATATAGNNLCLLQSSTGQVSGVIGVVVL